MPVGNETTTVYLLGDSITQGLGSKQMNFSKELERLIGESYEVKNLAYTGTTIGYALELLNGGEISVIPNRDSICVILYGNVDAQIRPNRKGLVFPHIPKRYQGGGMLMPRPFYSKSFKKHLGQVFDNTSRKVLSSIIKAVDGTEQWVSIDSFTRQYEQLLDQLQAMRMKLIPCSCVYIDERLFPGTPRQYELFDGRIEHLASERNLPFVDFFSLFKARVESDGWDSVYNKDHFHPNSAGYELMAETIAAKIVAV